MAPSLTRFGIVGDVHTEHLALARALASLRASGAERIRRYATPLGPLLLCHGLDDDDMTGVRPWDEGYAVASNDALQRLLCEDDIRWIACGHTHHRMIRRLGALTILNAGTLLRGHDPGFLLVDLSERVAYAHDLLPDDRVALVDALVL